MPHFEYACVQLGLGEVNDRHLATEHVDPDEEEQDDEIVRYVEVVPGSKSYVSVTLDKNFDWKNADVVGVKVNLDGKRAGSMYLTKERYNSKQNYLSGTWSGSGSTAVYHQWTFAKLDTSL